MIQVIYSGTITEDLLQDIKDEKESALEDFYEVAIKEIQEAVKKGKFFFNPPIYSSSEHLVNERYLFSMLVDITKLEGGDAEHNGIPGPSSDT